MVAKARVDSSRPVFNRQWIAVLVAVGVVAGGAAIVGSRVRQSATEPMPVVLPEITTVTALGWLEPQGEVVRLSAPSSANGHRIAELLVREGDRVEAGQEIAILDNYAQREAALAEAQARVEIAEANLAVVRAGAKAGEIQAQRAAIARYEAELRNNTAAQEATVARLEAELRTAEADENRYRQLYEEGAISASEWDSLRLATEEARLQVEEGQANLARIQSGQQQQLNEAIATLERIAEIRSVDVDVAAAEVRAARAAEARARAELDLAAVTAPQSGQIINIYARPGEVISTEGIVDIGRTSQMVAVAEVYESDIRKIRLGQPVQVTSSALPGVELTGEVEHIDLDVRRQTVINEDPSANIDAKTVEIRVLLDGASSQQVSGLTNLRVIVTVDIQA